MAVAWTRVVGGGGGKRSDSGYTLRVDMIG